MSEILDSLIRALTAAPEAPPAAPQPFAPPAAPVGRGGTIRPANQLRDTLHTVLESLRQQPLSRILDIAGMSPVTGAHQTLVEGQDPLQALGPDLAGFPALSRGPIRAFHGSPHDFDKFDLSKIGTGEGAQSYGHGLYFAESPSVAETYRAKVSALHRMAGRQAETPLVDGRSINWDDPIETAAFELARHRGDRAAAASFHELAFGNTPAAQLLRSDASLPDVRLPGRMYEVNIHADPEQMLNWDVTVGQQPEHVANAMLDMAGQRIPLGSPESSAFLRERGVPGIKYLDQASRASGQGTRNYVVFDDRLIDILKKWGLLPAAVGTGAALGGEDEP